MPLLRNRVLDQDRMVATDCLFWYYSLLIQSTLYEEDVYIGKLPTAKTKEATQFSLVDSIKIRFAVLFCIKVLLYTVHPTVLYFICH